MELRRIKVSDIKKAPYNPRVDLQPGDPEFEKLKRSITVFGDADPIVWNEVTGHAVDGNQTLAVLRYLGETETIVSVVHYETIKEEMKANLALDKIKGGWEHNKLEALLAEFEPDKALLSGFDAQEISLMLAKNDDVEEDFDFASFEEDDADDGGEYEAAPGTSYIVSLVFKNNYFAQEWAKQRGYAKAVKDGKKTTVIRME